MRALSLGPPGARFAVHDVRNGGRADLPGELVWVELDPPSDDAAVNEAADGSRTTHAFYEQVLGRDSVDDRGLPLVSCVHFGVMFENAFWDGVRMVYGDGGGQIFLRGGLTAALDVIAHELTHGVIQFSARLEYRLESGALNESFADVMGSLVKQHALGQSAEEADWLIGAGIMNPSIGRALRSMSAPGTANRFDRQPAHMSDFVVLPDDNDPRNDNGGVHINSGIPNRAFHLAATAIGGPAWETAGRIWYQALTRRLGPTSDFAAAAESTVDAAVDLFGAGGREDEAVRRAWAEVGLR